MGLPNRNDGSPMPAQIGAGGGFIPKGAKNVQVAKEFMRYFMQPEVINENLKGGLGRWVPVISSIVTEDRGGSIPRTRTDRPTSTRPRWANHRQFQRIQSGLGSGQRRADLGAGPFRCHQERDDANGGCGQGVQACRGDLHQIHVRVE